MNLWLYPNSTNPRMFMLRPWVGSIVGTVTVILTLVSRAEKSPRNRACSGAFMGSYQNWMVYLWENPMKIDDLRVAPWLRKPPWFRPKAISFNAAISSCEKCGQWQSALRLLYEAEWNSTIGSLGRGKHVLFAIEQRISPTHTVIARKLGILSGNLLAIEHGHLVGIPIKKMLIFHSSVCLLEGTVNVLDMFLHVFCYDSFWCGGVLK